MTGTSVDGEGEGDTRKSGKAIKAKVLGDQFCRLWIYVVQREVCGARLQHVGALANPRHIQ